MEQKAKTQKPNTQKQSVQQSINSGEESDAEIQKKERLARQLAQVVCICKGIPLAKVLRGLPGSRRVADVDHKVGTGQGGCQGRRCGPKIAALLAKQAQSDS